jgi:hypothetical protein
MRVRWRLLNRCRLGLMLSLAPASAGCASIWGFDDLTVVDAGGGDASVGDSSGSASGSGGSSGGSSGSSNGSDSGSDSGSGGSSGSGSGSSSGTGSGTGADSGSSFDAAFDSGCGDLNSVSNCSACGDKCAANASETSAACCAGTTCPGSTDGVNDSCQYTCATGYIDCDGPAGTNPPNTNGCECHVPGATASQCCAGGCPVQHVDGLVGQSYYPKSDTFYDCVPAGTMNLQLAADACAAYVTARGGNAATNCGEFGPTDGGPPDRVCAITAGNCGSNCTGYDGDCICWTASGTYKGQVLDPVALGLDNQCYTGQSSLTFN